jgi:thioredoxin 1
MASRATLKKMERDGLSCTSACKELIPVLYQQLSQLPDWGSARDVYRNVLPAMYSKRANRLGNEVRRQRILEEEGIKSNASATATGNEESLSRRARAVKKAAAPVCAPYEETDVREAFGSIINARSQGMINVNPTTGNGDTANPAGVQPVNAMESFYSLLALTKSQRIILVVDFFASWCTPCVQVKPKFEAMSGEFPQAKFIVVDHELAAPIFEKEGVDSMPTVKLYANGSCVYTIVGGNEFELRTRITQFSSLLGQSPSRTNVIGRNNRSKDGSYSPPTITEEPETAYAPKQAVKIRENVESMVMRPEDEVDEELDDIDEKAIWAALEEACGELKYSLDQMEEFLSTKEFPEDLLELIKSKTGSRDIDKVRAMLLPQAPRVLQKV